MALLRRHLNVYEQTVYSCKTQNASSNMTSSTNAYFSIEILQKIQSTKLTGIKEHDTKADVIAPFPNASLVERNYLVYVIGVDRPSERFMFFCRCYFGFKV
jgi:hypothetical protein